MILYFSGTGNSAYIAKRLGQALGDETLDLLARLRAQDFSPMESAGPWVVVCPTYAWQMPRILYDYLQKAELTGSRAAYFVLTCGGSIGNAGEPLQKLCAAKGMEYRGCAGVVMPDNYIVMMDAPPPEKSRVLLRRAERRVKSIAGAVRDGRPLPQPQIKAKDRLCSGPVHQAACRLLVHDKKFRATDACISCGQCAALCPLNNIRLEGGRPVWGGQCTHCMACICRCPKQAIEYGSKTQGRARYTCPENGQF